MARKLIRLFASESTRPTLFLFSIALLIFDVLEIILYALLYNKPNNKYNIFNQIFGTGSGSGSD